MIPMRFGKFKPDIYEASSKDFLRVVDDIPFDDVN